jgi:hypothetical protein
MQRPAWDGSYGKGTQKSRVPVRIRFPKPIYVTYVTRSLPLRIPAVNN